jgi:hypothetical protein
LSGPALRAHWNALRGDPYPLDSIERMVDGPVPCSDESMVSYAGTHVRYFGPLRVHPDFRERLMRFEEVTAEVAREFYGRTPRRIRHLGAFSCRASRYRSYRLSEHALGNAIDVAGFDFGPASKQEPLAPGAPTHLRQPFEVRVSRHWNRAHSPAAALHDAFLQELTRRIVDRRDIFRVALGPAHRGHSDHFHFDMSPWRYTHL